MLDNSSGQSLSLLHPSDFCAKWVPKKEGKQPGEYGYRKRAHELLSKITGHEASYCDKLLSKPSENVPHLFMAYLALVDKLWDLQEESSAFSEESLKKMFHRD